MMRLISDGEDINLAELGIRDAGFKVTESALKITSFINNIGISRHIKTDQDPYIVECKFIIIGKNMEDAKKKFYTLKHRLHSCEIYLKQEEDTFYKCTAKQFVKQNLSGRTILMTATFDAEVLSKRKSVIINSSCIVDVGGVRMTPINIKINAGKDITELKINDITIRQLKKDETMIIDSENCKITIDGEDIRDDVVDLIEFPYAVGIFEIAMNQQVEVEINYCGRW